MRFLRVILTVVIICSLVVACGAVAAFVYLRKISTAHVPSELLERAIENKESTLYFYRDGDQNKIEVLAHGLSGSPSKYIHTPISEMPQRLIEAFVAIEDKRFFEHDGVDMLRSARAIANYVFKRSDSFGASTITQQLIKNLTGRAERTPSRKIREMFMALNLESTHTKSEILELYLNVINLSCGCTGVGAASRYYFSKEVRELSLPECATVAAITNNPSYYNPKKHPENTRERRDVVLLCMRDQGYISDEEYKEAKNSPLNLNVDSSMDEGNIYSWFYETLISDLVCGFEEKGYTREYALASIFRGGLDIYTTVDPEIQSALEREYVSLADRLGDVRSSAIVLDRYNGDILGIVGGVGKKQANLIQNYATDTKRPPGSAIKPLSVYAPLIDRGKITWSTVVEDSPVDRIDGNDWPRNSNGKYLGSTNIRYALAHSTNTVAVKLLRELGGSEAFDILKNRLGMKSLDEKRDMGDAALALGQLSRGVTLRELVSAYTVFADGIYSRARSYYKVTDASGEIILDNRDNQSIVFKRESADIMTRLLCEVVKNGTARGYGLDENFEVAGKTGTTQNNCDRLFVGYTPSVVAGVWCGNDYATPLPAELGNPSVPIWGNIIDSIYGSDRLSDSPRHFEVSERVQLLSYGKDSGELISESDEGEWENGWFYRE